MEQLGFPNQKKNPFRSSSQCRDETPPDSIIFTNQSNFSLFSSASVSADRCSFASDQIYDHESLISELSKHLAGDDPDLGQEISKLHKYNFPITSREYTKEEEEEGEEEEEVEKGEGDREEFVTLDPAKCSFSLALRECQYRRRRVSPLAQKKPERQRPVSLDLKNSVIDTGCSPSRLRAMRKSSVSSRNLDAFPSPVTPNYWQGNTGSQKGWCSERVPLSSNGGRRYVPAGVLPFNHGRTLPSKWEDAEKWIFSPFAGDGVNQSLRPPPHRRPKSKSGPIGPQEIAYNSTYSPSVHMFRGRTVSNYVTRSPFSTGVLVADDLSNQGPCRDGSNSSSGNGSIGREICCAINKEDPSIVRSASTQGLSSNTFGRSSLSSSKDADGSKEAVTMSSLDRRDVATQMSPESSGNLCHLSTSSPRPSLLPITEMQNHHSKLEVRDVEVDERVTVTRWSRKHGSRESRRKGSTDTKDQKRSGSEAKASDWEVAETGISKSKREEAKITAWENLQKAKAETAIRKLEMKLEKKRSSSMDKIINKLRSAQRKAQKMRNSVSSKENHQVSHSISSKAISSRKNGHQIGSLGGCFTCHAC